MRRQYLVQFRFLQVVLVDRIPLSSCTVYRISFWRFSTWYFNPWTVCFPDLLLPSETVFHNLCTVLYWCLCSLTNSPIVKYPLNWGWCALSAEGFLKQWLPNGKPELLLQSLTKCHGVPCSLPSRITTKVLKNCKTFSSRARPRPRPILHDLRPRPGFLFLSSRRLETKTLVSTTTSLYFTVYVYYI